MINENLKNKNRGYRKLEVWKKAIELYVSKSTKLYQIEEIPYKVINQLMGSAFSIHSNIAEGYFRRTLNEYLYHLNVAFGSLGELGSGLFACRKAGQIDEKTYNLFDKNHYDLENKLLKLIESLQKKQLSGDWEDSLF
jgi:four helix bundle protein